jgi:cysteine desulfurase/selenocysteine lyase
VPALAALACDFMAFSGHKMYGPMGIGALVGRRDALERLVPLRLGGDMVAWVSATDAGYAALPARWKAARPTWPARSAWRRRRLHRPQVGRARHRRARHALRAQAAAGLAALPGVTVLSPARNAGGHRLLRGRGVHPHDIGTLLDERGIAVRTGHHCAQPLLDHLGLGPTTRASFALYNTPAEVERLVAGVARALEVLR